MILIIRGHIRTSFDTLNLYYFIKKIIHLYPELQIYIHTWNIFANNISWRNIDENILYVNNDTIYTYFHDIKTNIKNIIIDDDKTIKLNGNVNGNFGNSKIPLIGWKNYWYGKYKIINHLYNNYENKSEIVINMRFDLLDNSNNFDEQTILNFIKYNYNKTLNKNIFLFDKEFQGMDNIYIGNIHTMYSLALLFNNELDFIHNCYKDISHPEYLVYKINSLLFKNTILLENNNTTSISQSKNTKNNIYLYDCKNDNKLTKILFDLVVLHSYNYNLNIINNDNIKDFIDDIPINFEYLTESQKIEYIKIYVVYKNGGIWLDTNTLVLNDLQSLFDLLETHDGFFIRDDKNNICNTFGSKSNTLLLSVLKVNINNNVFDLFTDAINKQNYLFQNYLIFNGSYNMFPINNNNSIDKYIINKYTDYKDVYRYFQPLIILNNNLFDLYNIIYSNYNIVNNLDTTLNYFIYKSNENIYQNNIITYDQITSVNYDTYFMIDKNKTILKIEDSLNLKINNDIQFGIHFIDYIITKRPIILLENKFMFNEYFSTIYNINVDLDNYHSYNAVLDKILESKILHDITILLWFSFMSHIFFPSAIDIKKYRIYKLLIFDLLLSKLPSDIYTDLNTFILTFPINYSYYFIYHADHNANIYKKITKIIRKICSPLKQSIDLLDTSIYSTKKNNKIKIGFIGNSHINSNHSVSKDRLGVIDYLIKQKDLDIYLLTDNDDKNTYNDFSKNYNKLIILNKNTDISCNEIKKHKFDILIYPEIGLNQTIKILAYLRLAPIQITTWGNSETSGINTIDYYISSALFEKFNNNTHYTEKLILLKSLGTYYYDKNSIHPYKPDLVLKLKNILNIPNDANIYGCLQMYHKYQENTITCFKKILEKDKKGYILLLDDGSEMSEHFKNYVFSIIDKNSVNKIKFVGMTDLQSFVVYIDTCVILLDIINFGGCNTSFDSFSRNKIVITMQTDLLCSSFTSGFYKKMGINKFICTSNDEYIDKAVYYANNDEKRKYYEQLISENKKLIFEDHESCIEWYDTLKKLYNSHIIIN